MRPVGAEAGQGLLPSVCRRRSFDRDVWSAMAAPAGPTSQRAKITRCGGPLQPAPSTRAAGASRAAIPGPARQPSRGQQGSHPGASRAAIPGPARQPSRGQQGSHPGPAPTHRALQRHLLLGMLVQPSHDLCRRAVHLQPLVHSPSVTGHVPASPEERQPLLHLLHHRVDIRARLVAGVAQQHEGGPPHAAAVRAADHVRVCAHSRQQLAARGDQQPQVPGQGGGQGGGGGGQSVSQSVSQDLRPHPMRSSAAAMHPWQAGAVHDVLTCCSRALLWQQPAAGRPRQVPEGDAAGSIHPQQPGLDHAWQLCT